MPSKKNDRRVKLAKHVCKHKKIAPKRKKLILSAAKHKRQIFI